MQVTDEPLVNGTEIPCLPKLPRAETTSIRRAYPGLSWTECVNVISDIWPKNTSVAAETCI